MQPDRARSSEPERDPSGTGREILLQASNVTFSMTLTPHASAARCASRSLVGLMSLHSLFPDLCCVASAQGFNWESHTLRDSHRQPGWLTQLATHAQELAECGVTSVWLPPPCHSIAEQGYMPQVLCAACAESAD